MKTGIIGAAHSLDHYHADDPRARRYVSDSLQHELMHHLWSNITGDATFDELAEELPAPVSIHFVEVVDRPEPDLRFAAFAPAELRVQLLVLSEDPWRVEMDGVVSDNALKACRDSVPTPAFEGDGFVVIMRYLQPKMEVRPLLEYEPVTTTIGPEYRRFRWYRYRRSDGAMLLCWKRVS